MNGQKCQLAGIHLADGGWRGTSWRSYPLFSRDLQLDLLLPHLLPLAVVPVERTSLLLGLLLPGRLAENVVITVCSTEPASVVLNKKLIHVLFIRNISQVLGFSAGVFEFLNMA